MKNHLIRLFLYTCIALVPISCGTRKVGLNVLKNAEIVKIEQKSEVAVKKSEVKTEAVKEVAKSENIDEDKSVVVTELYNEQGVIKSRVVTINTNKKSNNTTYDKESIKTDKKDVDSVGKKSDVQSNEVTSYSKEKTTTRKNDGWYYVVGIISVIGLLFWLKPWR